VPATKLLPDLLLPQQAMILLFGSSHPSRALSCFPVRVARFCSILDDANWDFACFNNSDSCLICSGSVAEDAAEPICEISDRSSESCVIADRCRLAPVKSLLLVSELFDCDVAIFHPLHHCRRLHLVPRRPLVQRRLQNL